MSDIAIRSENLGKLYRIGQLEPYKSLRETLTNAMSAPLRAITSAVHRQQSAADRSPSSNTIWALKDASFQVKQGEVIGIIGRNGAGKSTLLKLLSRITMPTEGYAEIHGRVGALLEVGTGFHPELTGRENIYLNGAVLGMKRTQIERKFDDIVAFAEVEEFIDTPLKRYSSGMQVRLAFSVAAHLEPEILLVDEVLAVGDTMFQRKCLGKMGEVSRGGRTVLFVSHNMHNIIRLCEKTILLDDGRVRMIDETKKVVDKYLSFYENLGAEKTWDASNAPQTKEVRLEAVRVVNRSGQVSSNFMISEPIYLEIELRVLKSYLGYVHLSFHVYRGGAWLFSTGDIKYVEDNDIRYGPGLYRATCSIPAHLLNDGEHYVSAHVNLKNKNILSTEEIVHFTVHDDGSMRGSFGGGWGGEIRPLLDWKHKQLE